MSKQWDTTQEGFDQLLAWLDEDRDQAARKYEVIRKRLVKTFTCRGCWEPEDCTDETIKRVTAKLHEVAATYQGEKVLYFYGFARNVLREWRERQNRLTTPPPPDPPDDDDEQAFECLDHCMETVPEKSRQLVLRYYENEKKAKIDDRQAQADELDIGINALRIRAHRIRLVLRKCVESCMEQQPAN